MTTEELTTEVPVAEAPAAPAQTLASDSGILNAPSAPAAPVATPPDPGREWIPEEFRGESALQPIQDVPNLIKSFVNAQKQIGLDKMVVPNEHSTPEQVKAAYQRLGLPSELTSYQLEVPKDAEFNDGFITGLKEAMFKANILPNQGSELLNWYAEANKQAQAAQEQQYQADLEKGIGDLKQEWGNAFQQKVQAAKNMLTKFGDEQVFDWIDKEGLADDKMLIKLLSKIGEAFFQEDGLVGEGQTVALTPSSAKAEWQKIQADKAHAYWDKQHPGHQKAMDDVKHLFAQMHPEG